MSFHINDLFSNSSSIQNTQTDAAGNAASVSGSGNASGAVSRENGKAAATLSELTQGQSFTGQIKQITGDQVTLSIGNQAEITARLEGNTNLSVGQSVLFEVKSNTNQKLSITPLGVNTSGDTSAAFSALKAAGMPLTADNVSMVNSMMQEGMPVDRNSLWNMSKLTSSFSEYGSELVVQLSSMGMEVNADNLSQLEAYQNMKSQIVSTFSDLSAQIGKTLQSFAQEGQNSAGFSFMKNILVAMAENMPVDLTGESDGAAGILSGSDLQTGNGLAGDILQAGNELSDGGMQAGNGLQTGDILQAGNELSDGGIQAGNGLQTDDSIQTRNSSQADNDILQSGETLQNRSLQDGNENATIENVQQTIKNMQTGTILESMKELQTDTAVQTDTATQKDGSIPLSASLQDTAIGNTTQVQQNAILQALRGMAGKDVRQFFTLFNQLSPTSLAQALRSGTLNLQQLSQTMQDALAELAGKMDPAQYQSASAAFHKLFQAQISNQWMMEPENFADKKEVHDFYTKLEQQTAKISEAFAQSGKTATPAGETIQQLNQNLQFMHELNQVFPYLQIPLKTSMQNAHGELYVYSHRKGKTAEDGSASALLHLDMQNLGTVDVYVKLLNQKVSTHFYLADESMIDFLESHMGLLSERLSQKGYQLNSAVTLKDQKDSNHDFISRLNGDEETGRKLISVSSFDMRA